MENADNKKQEPCPKCCCERTTERSEKEYKDLIHRLNRIEGQIRGIRGMVENCLTGQSYQRLRDPRYQRGEGRDSGRIGETVAEANEIEKEG